MSINKESGGREASEEAVVTVQGRDARPTAGNDHGLDKGACLTHGEAKYSSPGDQ